MNKNIMRQMGFDKEVDAVEHGFCPLCNKPVSLNDFKNELFKKEYGISGLCQKCQNKIFC